jgi:hypothetical protein
LVINGQGQELSARATLLIIMFCFISVHFFHDSTALVALGAIGVLEIAHHNAPHSVGLLCTFERPIVEPSIPASERAQAHTVDRAATELGIAIIIQGKYS